MDLQIITLSALCAANLPSWNLSHIGSSNAKGVFTMWHEPLARYENCGLRMRRECRERFHRHRLRRKPLVSNPGMHHDTCVIHVSWCMAGSLSRIGGENFPGIPGECATHNFTYLARGPWWMMFRTYRYRRHLGDYIRLDRPCISWSHLEKGRMTCTPRDIPLNWNMTSD